MGLYASLKLGQQKVEKRLASDTSIKGSLKSIQNEPLLAENDPGKIIQ